MLATQLDETDRAIIHLPTRRERICAQKQEIIFTVFAMIAITSLLLYSKSLNLKGYKSKVYLYMYFATSCIIMMITVAKICHICGLTFPIKFTVIQNQWFRLVGCNFV